MGATAAAATYGRATQRRRHGRLQERRTACGGGRSGGHAERRGADGGQGVVVMERPRNSDGQRGRAAARGVAARWRGKSCSGGAAISRGGTTDDAAEAAVIIGSPWL